MTLPPASFNLAAYVLAQAVRVPDKDALIIAGPQSVSWTYSTLEARVRALGAGFLKMGLRSGDRVLMRLGNNHAFPVTYLAAIAVGLVAVPTSAQLTKPEITRIAQQTTPALIVADATTTLPDYDAPVLMADQFDEFAKLTPCDFDMGDPNRPAYIIYTSGTSGHPRAVVHAHRAIWARRAMFDGWYGLTSEDRVLHAGAFNWSYTLGTGLLDPWTMGATAIVGYEDAARLGDALSETKATIFAAAPGVFRQMLKADLPALPNLRHGLSAGEKLPEKTLSTWREKTGTPICEAFGMSECSTFISGSPKRPAPAGTIGYIQDGRNIAVLDEEGRAAHGNIGRISIHQDECGLMLGYLTPDGRYDLPLQHRYFQTGDLAARTQDDALIYHGRSDDMMNAGGYRVSPLEVEAAFSDHPKITQVACCEVFVKSDASVIAAFYTAPDVLDQDDLKAFASTVLAQYKQPRLYVHVDGLPRGANNKLLRRQLRRDWETSHGQT